MHAFLILGNSASEIDKQISKLTDNQISNLMEFSIDKIEKTRELGNFLKLSQTPGTTILIKDVDLATVDSLNAFLKNLEEPSDNVVFILTAKNEFRVLPTILSRCQIVRTKIVNPGVADKSSEEFLNSTTGGKMKIMDKIKKREEAVEFVQNLISILQEKLKNGGNDIKKIGGYMSNAQNTLDALNQNGNVTMQLTNLVVNMEKPGQEGSDTV